MRYVLIGAGPAGVVAAETLRKADPEGDILLLGDEPEPPYSRMALPYFLVGTIDEAGTYLRKSETHYDELGIAFRHARALKIDPAGKTVALEGGESVPYDRLMIATGSSTVTPPVPGIGLPGVHPCWTLADSREIARRATPDSRVVLMGAGFIGCIVLESLIKRGVKPTVVEMADRMVPRMMNAAAGGLIKKWCATKGIEVLTSTKVTAIEDTGEARDPLRVMLDKGAPLRAALVVVATGVRPNIAFLDGSGIETDFGIRVDSHLKSSADGVYAAGDVAQGPDFMGGWSVHAIQPTAVEHGRIAALNMAGGNASYHGSLAMNVLDTAGLVSSSFGQWQGVEGGESVERMDEERFRYTRLEFDGEHLVGAICLGRTDQIGMLRGLIQSRVRLGDWKARLMEDPQRISEAYVASTQK
ncbi:NAD(P)/FAD-dependent oxidoreductase [Shumkonia mesophila]|uniref:NAD(P)/FAD-dependent oxidoreductase n=1 Tax=Shumkonia mesophila TaxID=2838854 RepID=UPI0029342524|nr:FAD-dependent oxidoreductase [Shumkonia mesophila]